jgi:uncharacterized membrane protein
MNDIENSTQHNNIEVLLGVLCVLAAGMLGVMIALSYQVDTISSQLEQLIYHVMQK